VVRQDHREGNQKPIDLSLAKGRLSLFSTVLVNSAALINHDL
jgi:hypothetical protein